MAGNKKKKNRRKPDAGTIIFRAVGIELAVIAAVLVILGIVFVPRILNSFGVSIPELLGLSDSSETEAPTGATQVASLTTAAGDAAESAAEPETEDNTPEEQIAQISLMAVGDNLMRRSGTLSGLQSDGTYSYYDNFVNMRNAFRSADLTVLSQDTVMAGTEYGVTEGDLYTTGTEIGESMVDAGINVITAANNHIMDMGADGLNNMINYWHSTYPQVTLLGVNQSGSSQTSPVVIDVSGVKVAMINYTTLSNETDALDSEPYLVNLYDEDWLADIVSQCSESADFIVAFPHWGHDSGTDIADEETEQAQLLADLGVDLVIGNGTGAAQPAEWIQGSGGNYTLVYYSLGDFQSTEEKTENMLGGQATITITKTNKRTYISSCSLGFTVTQYSDQTDEGYFSTVTTFPWSDYLEEMAADHGILAWEPDFSYDALDDLRKAVLKKSDLTIPEE
ncbi:MAG: CapA family protein [Lachnospiraceae bacterium]|jgi:hypothetical protein